MGIGVHAGFRWVWPSQDSTLLPALGSLLPGHAAVHKPEPEVCFTICLIQVPDAQEQLAAGMPGHGALRTCLPATKGHLEGLRIRFPQSVW